MQTKKIPFKEWDKYRFSQEPTTKNPKFNRRKNKQTKKKTSKSLKPKRFLLNDGAKTQYWPWILPTQNPVILNNFFSRKGSNYDNYS